MAQAGSAYNTHNRHQENHVKIGNWVEERALIETAPKMCVPVSLHNEPGCSAVAERLGLTRAGGGVAGVGRRESGDGGQGPMVQQDDQGATPALPAVSPRASPPLALPLQRRAAFVSPRLTERGDLARAQPDAHETRFVAGSFIEPEEYTTCTRDDFAPVQQHVEPKVGLREAALVKALMEEASKVDEEPAPKLDTETEYGAYARESKPRAAPAESYADMAPITVYTHNGKNSIAADGNFAKNTDFSTPAESYTKGPYKIC